MESYLDLKSHIEDLIRTAELDIAFEVLKEKEYLLSSDLRAEVVLLEGRFNQLENDKNLNQINTSDYSVGLSSISKALFYVLAQEHIPSPSVNNNKKEGVILHDIPSKMPLNTFTKVVIRLSDEEESLLEDFDRSDDTVIESVRIADVMEVHLDSEDYDAFEIRSVSGDQQFIEYGTFTEWIFKVKPLKAGTQILELRVVVLEQINDKERQRVEVLERKVQVVTDIAELSEDVFERPVYKTDIQVSTDRLQQTILERKNNPTLTGSMPSKEVVEKIREMQDQYMADADESSSMPSSSSKKSVKRGSGGEKKEAKTSNNKKGKSGIGYRLFGVLIIIGLVRVATLDFSLDDIKQSEDSMSNNRFDFNLDDIKESDESLPESNNDVIDILEDIDDIKDIDFAPSEEELNDLTEKVELKDELDLVLVKGGTHSIDLNEASSQKVNLPSFYMSKSAITVSQFRVFCEKVNRKMPEEPEGGWVEDEPITNINWADATSYCVWLGVEILESVRLPTEVEWSYAAAQNDTKTAAINYTKDLQAEWCLDWYSETIEYDSLLTKWLEIIPEGRKVVRGLSPHSKNPEDLSIIREAHPPFGYFADNIGFRVVVSGDTSF